MCWSSIFPNVWLFTWALHLGLFEDKGNLFPFPQNFHESCQLSIGQVSYDWTFTCGFSGTSCPWNVCPLTGSLCPNVLQYFQWHERFKLAFVWPIPKPSKAYGSKPIVSSILSHAAGHLKRIIAFLQCDTFKVHPVSPLHDLSFDSIRVKCC